MKYISLAIAKKVELDNCLSAGVGLLVSDGCEHASVHEEFDGALAWAHGRIKSVAVLDGGAVNIINNVLVNLDDAAQLLLLDTAMLLYYWMSANVDFKGPLARFTLKLTGLSDIARDYDAPLLGSAHLDDSLVWLTIATSTMVTNDM